MLAALLTLAFFFAWCVVGLATLAAVGADVRELRVALTAPVIGTAVVLVPLFTLSNVGVPMEAGALPVAVALLVGSLAVLAVRRPRLPAGVVPVAALCIVELALVGRPMFEFGFNWLANANADMALYVLAATNLMDHGLLSPVDVDALAANRDFATSVQRVHLDGLRPGSQIALAGLAAITGLRPTAVYMPMILALNMCGICGAGALAMQAARRWWAASVAAALLVASPLAAYAVLQQLMPQVWGLALAVALLAWLMRPQMHQTPGPRLPDLLVISILTAALFVVYVEVAASLSVAYALYVAFLFARRQVSLRAVGLLWGVPLLAIVIVVNTFLPRELGYLASATSGGLSGVAGVTLFGYALVPTALPGVVGLQKLFAAPTTAYMGASIIVAAALAAAALTACLVTARRGAAASIVLLGDLVLGAVLALNGNDFGLFKLYMYIQPFLAAAAAVALSALRTKRIVVVAGVLLGLIAGAQLVTANAYVEDSRHPIDLRNASEADLLPTFRHLLTAAREPVVAVTENLSLSWLFGAQANEIPVYFVSRDVFNLPWQERRFHMRGLRSSAIRFEQNSDAAKVLDGNRCLVALPTGSQLPMNRRQYPERSPNLIQLRCGEARNVLVFVVSSLGQPFSIPEDRRAVSFWPLERDPSFSGRTFAGFGRYALFQILRPSPRLRVSLDFGTSSIVSGSEAYELPPAAIVGLDRASFRVAGSGSGRVFSPVISPRMIGGQPYIVLDMGRDGEFPRVARPGLTGLWGRTVTLDPRLLTSYVRDISLLTDAEYSRLRAPTALRAFPADLADPGLEYSGIYEDGWVGTEAFAMLAGGPAGTFALRADVLPRMNGQHLDVRVDGQTVYSSAVRPGALDLSVQLPASSERRHVELRWAGEARLAAPDRRLASARLLYLGMAPPPAVVRVPADLDRVGFVHTGIFADGWSEPVATATLRGGGPGNLVIQADVPLSGQRLRVLVNGRQVASQQVAPGRLDLRVPLPLSPGPRRVEVRWAVTAPISTEDPRVAAARFTLLAVPPPPVQVRTEDLGDPALVASGVSADGWLERRSSLLLRGGPAASLVIRARVPEEALGQRLIVRLDGRELASIPVTPGELEFRGPLPPAAVGRRLELLWAKAIALAKPDTRRASARLLLASVAPARSASIVRPQDLADLRLAYSGIYRDGWMERRVRLLLAGGRAAHLRLNSQVVLPGQQLTVLLDGRTIAVEPVRQGDSETRVLLPASTGLRDVELRWAKAAPLAANDRRPAAALLRSAAVDPVKTPLRIGAGDLDDPSLAYSGIYADGWIRRSARLMLAGGPAAGLTLRAEVVVPDQRLRVLVDGRTVADQAVPPGATVVRVPIPPSGRPRSVELRWAKEEPLAPDDRRRAAARLREILIVDAGAPQRVTLGELDDPALLHAGIYGDGWMERGARFALAGGPAGTLTLRAQVVVPAQALQVVVGSRVVASQAVGQGEVVVSAPIPASVGPRFVELRWAKTARLAPNDARAAAGRLRSLAITEATSEVVPSAERRLEARLSVSASVPPSVTPPVGARGTFTATLEGRTLRWRLVVSSLSGPVVAAVIRGGGAAERGPRLVELCAPCSTPASGVVELTAAQVAQLTAAATYVNVGTTANPDGEIRGQIVRR